MTDLDDALRLSRMLAREKKALDKNDAYFEGEQPLRFIAPVLEQELGFRLSPIVLNLALFAVDVYDNRLDIEGFRVQSNARTVVGPDGTSRRRSSGTPRRTAKCGMCGRRTRARTSLSRRTVSPSPSAAPTRWSAAGTARTTPR